jgi:membrane-bound ClpP family serine protease
MLLPAAEGINLPWGEIISGGYSMMQRIAILLFGCLLAASFAAFFSRTFLMRTKFYSKMILKDVGGRASEGEDLTCLIGEKGAAETSLRPCGKVLIRGRIYNASAESLYIEKASAVVVRRVEGQMIFVEPSPLV